MAKAILICGKICCGKSTYARELKAKAPAVTLSVDDLMLAMFPPQLGDMHDEIAAKARAYILDRAVDIISAGMDVILEWGFWTRADREGISRFFRERGVKTQWHYISVSDGAWEESIRLRNAAIEAGESGDYFVDENLKAKCLARFEAPDRGEMDVWHERG